MAKAVRNAADCWNGAITKRAPMQADGTASIPAHAEMRIRLKLHRDGSAHIASSTSA
eukprot:CAMPEP_0115300098 /NCGR_PEP_ID=MMETSP0270-20121206/69153_1 /TAXON_ID=71861 /ORGANISM="Scrippsiella trochoidea, Strain CCMP3099" /LENGTH=56 /DNA_ID=CAMNT_0002717905 /DNA_START=8 /DNA_END=175 /DNA_ORIENTATION=+